MKRSLLRLGAPVAAAALLLAACSGSGSNSGSTAGSGDGATADLAPITANGSEPQNPLVPTNTNEVGGGRIIDLVFAGLVYYDAAGKVQLDVAESIESDDSQLYTIKLKKDQKFSDGSPVTASSFVDAWNQAVRDNHLSSHFFTPIKGFPEGEEKVEKLEGLKVVDDNTFTIELKQPEADFKLRLGYSAFYPLPEAGIGDADKIKEFGGAPIGNGPYMLAGPDAWHHDESISLVPNPEYNGPQKAQNGGVNFTFYAKQDAAYNDLLSGNLDVLDAVPDSAYGNFTQELGDRAVNQPASIFQSFTIPSRLPHFSGEEGNLRKQAISKAINREEICNVIFQGTRTPATDFTSPVIDGWDGNIEGNDVLKYDPEGAKELWAKANEIADWGDSKLELAYNADGGHQAWVDAAMNSVKNTLGIEAVGKPYADFKSLRKEVTDRVIESGFRTGWQGDYPGLYNFLGPIYGTGAGSNDGDYSNPEFDKLLAEAAGAESVEAGNAKLVEAQKILFQDLPAIPLWYSNVTGGYAEGVENVVFGWNSVPVYWQITKKQ